MVHSMLYSSLPVVNRHFGPQDRGAANQQTRPPVGAVPFVAVGSVPVAALTIPHPVPGSVTGITAGVF